jgi:hypothetical protein
MLSGRNGSLNGCFEVLNITRKSSEPPFLECSHIDMEFSFWKHFSDWTFIERQPPRTRPSSRGSAFVAKSALKGLRRSKG